MALRSEDAHFMASEPTYLPCQSLTAEREMKATIKKGL